MFVGPIHVTHNDKRRINFSYRKALTAANLFPPLEKRNDGEMLDCLLLALSTKTETGNAHSAG
jgi:hypothetical protein